MNADAQIAINRAKYIAWLRTNFPDLYQLAVANVARKAQAEQMAGFFDTLGSAFGSVIKTVGGALPQLAQTYVAYDTQKRVIKANTQLAQQGLPPVMIDQATGATLPIPDVYYTQADLQLAMAGAQSATAAENNRMLAYLAVGAGVLLLLARR